MFEVSNNIERRVIQSYVHSNVYWPQTRASFVLVCLQSILSSDLEELKLISDFPGRAIWNSDLILDKVDKIHSSHGIWTVYPTKRSSVIRELNQSCKVLFRTLLAIFDDTPLSEMYVDQLQMPSKRIWQFVRASDYIEKNKKHISGPKVGPAKALKLDSNENEILLDFWNTLNSNFNSGWEQKIIDALKPEIIHSITIVREMERQKTLGSYDSS